MKSNQKNKNRTNSETNGTLGQKKVKNGDATIASASNLEEHLKIITNIDTAELVVSAKDASISIKDAFISAICDRREYVEELYRFILETNAGIVDLLFKFKLVDDIKEAYKKINEAFISKSKLLEQLNMPAEKQSILSREEPLTSETLVRELAEMQIPLRKKTIRGKVQHGYALDDFLEYLNRQQIDELPKNLLS